jgi:hypothetical protein
MNEIKEQARMFMHEMEDQAQHYMKDIEDQGIEVEMSTEAKSQSSSDGSMLLLSPYLVASQALAMSRVPMPGAVPFNIGTRFIPLRIVVAQLDSLLVHEKGG